MRIRWKRSRQAARGRLLQARRASSRLRGGGRRASFSLMLLHVLPAGPIQTNAYLLSAPELKEAVLIDAPGGIWEQIEPMLAKERCTLRELWLTHGHWDHTQGGAEVVAATEARVRAHRDDRVLIETPEVMEMFLIPGVRLAPLRDRRIRGAGAAMDGARGAGRGPARARALSGQRGVLLRGAEGGVRRRRAVSAAASAARTFRGAASRFWSARSASSSTRCRTTRWFTRDMAPTPLIGVERETNPFVHG